GKAARQATSPDACASLRQSPAPPNILAQPTPAGKVPQRRRRRRRRRSAYGARNKRQHTKIS
ncbi:MAG: hypothetical protein ACRDK2_01360, partial [Solirubrobacteraceae bacterium]